MSTSVVNATLLDDDITNSSYDLKYNVQKGQISRQTSLNQDTATRTSSERTLNMPISDIIELFQFRVFYVAILIVDTYLALIETYMRHEIMPQIYQEMRGSRSIISATTSRTLIIYNGINSFSNFSMVFFLLEMGFRLYSKGYSTLNHRGYLADFIALSIEICLEIFHFGKLSRICHIFSLWRVFELISSLREMDKEELQQLSQALEKAQSLAHKLEEELEVDKSERQAIEDSFKSYREEVDYFLSSGKVIDMNKDLQVITDDTHDASYDNGILHDYNDDFGVPSPKFDQFGLRNRQGSKT